MRNAARAYRPRFLNELHLRGVAWVQLTGFDDAINTAARQMCYRDDDHRVGCLRYLAGMVKHMFRIAMGERSSQASWGTRYKQKPEWG